MKKFTKLGVSALLTTTMLFGNVAYAAPMTTAVTSEESKTTNTPTYAEGQVMVMHRTDSNTVYSLGASQDEDLDMEISCSYDFTDVADDLELCPDNTTQPSLGGNGNQLDFKISLVTSNTLSTEKMMELLKDQPGVIAVEPNYRIYATDVLPDPYVDYQWALDNQGQNSGTVGMDVYAGNSKPAIEKSEDTPVIALVDTGIDYTHEDLADITWVNPFQSSQLRGAHGYDFINYDDDPMDDNGHGSHCSGIMNACSQNGTGISGIVGDSDVKIMALKILDAEGYGYGMEAVGAYNYIYKAQQLGVPVVAVNNSWGGMAEEESYIYETLINMIGEGGALSICAAGNESENNDSYTSLPANLDSPYVVSVAASNEKGELASFSNYGMSSVDLAAPGADILSTVSYDCFNPGIYTDRDSLCEWYENFSDVELKNAWGENATDTAEEGDFTYGLYTTAKGDYTQTVSASSDVFFGTKSDNSCSLEWKIENAKENSTYYLCIPYTLPASATPISMSSMVHGTGPAGLYLDILDLYLSGSFSIYDVEMPTDMADFEPDEALYTNSLEENCNYWSHSTAVIADSNDAPEERLLVFAINSSSEGDYSLYIDDLGISKADIEESAFGKYDYYNGTSMATPQVTGAVAILASAYPDESVLDRKNRLLGCTKTTEGLQGVVATNGTLDLSHIQDPNPSMSQIHYDEQNQEMIIEGCYLTDASVTINEEAVTIKENDGSVIRIDASKYLNQYLNVVVNVNELTFENTVFFTSGTPLEYESQYYQKNHSMATLAIGDSIYSVAGDGSVEKIFPLYPEDEYNTYSIDMGGLFDNSLFPCNGQLVGDYYPFFLSDPVSYGQRIWALLRLDVGFSQETILAYYEVGDMWHYAASLPENWNDISGTELAVYNGQLMLIGGINDSTQEFCNEILCYDMRTNKLTAGTPLPEPRAYASAVQTGDKLVVAFGADGSANACKMLIFDGKAWSTSASDTGIFDTTECYSYKEDGESSTYIQTLGDLYPVQGGVLIISDCIQGYGNTVFYQLSTDSFASTGYETASLSDSIRNYAVFGDKLYCFATSMSHDGVDDINPGLGKLSFDDLGSDDTGSDDMSMNSILCNVYTMPIKGCGMNIEECYFDGFYMEGFGSVLPGDLICLTGSLDENYLLNSFSVNGVKATQLEDGRYQILLLAEPGMKTDIQVLTQAYVSMILCFESELTLTPGESYQLDAFASPENAQNPKLSYSCSNPAVASIDSNGMIQVAANAPIGATAAITITAVDRGTVKETINLTIIAPPIPDVGETFTVGKYIYKVTKSSETTKTVSIVGTTKTKLTSLSVPSTVSYHGAKFKVTAIANKAFANCKKLKTVTIGKNVTSIGTGAFMNCTKLKTIKISSTKVTKIGKNAFKKISSKAKFSLPKAQKAKYKKLLKKSGYYSEPRENL